MHNLFSMMLIIKNTSPFHSLSLRCQLGQKLPISAGVMSSSLDGTISNRISFLQEQLSAADDPANIRTFQTQIKVLGYAQLDWLNELIALRRNDIIACKNVAEADRVFVELEALEWLQRQAQKHRR